MPKINKQKIVIELSVDQTQKYFEIASGKTKTEIDNDCLPSGSTIKIDVMPPFGIIASVNGHDLGEVSFEIIDLP